MFLDVWQECSYLNPAEMEALSVVSFFFNGIATALGHATAESAKRKTAAARA